MRFRGGEFSTGTMGNFQPELTDPPQVLLTPILGHSATTAWIPESLNGIFADV